MGLIFFKFLPVVFRKATASLSTLYKNAPLTFDNNSWNDEDRFRADWMLM
jgi:hypothetical protein